MKEKSVKINTTEPGQAKILINGVDVSNFTIGFTVSMSVSNVAKVTLELIPDEFEFEGEAIVSTIRDID